MNTYERFNDDEIVTVCAAYGSITISVEHRDTGSAYGIDLSYHATDMLIDILKEYEQDRYPKEKYHS